MGKGTLMCEVRGHLEVIRLYVRFFKVFFYCSFVKSLSVGIGLVVMVLGYENIDCESIVRSKIKGHLGVMRS